MHYEKSQLVKSRKFKKSRSRAEDETRPFSRRSFPVDFRYRLGILSCSGKTQVDGSRSGRKGLRNPPLHEESELHNNA